MILDSINCKHQTKINDIGSQKLIYFWGFGKGLVTTLAEMGCGGGMKQEACYCGDLN